MNFCLIHSCVCLSYIYELTSLFCELGPFLFLFGCVYTLTYSLVQGHLDSNEGDPELIVFIP